MDITKNGIPQYGYINQKYTKTGQLISSEPPVVLDKNSPIIQFENAYVKSKMVQLFGGQAVSGEITEQEASLVSNTLFNEKCSSLFKGYKEKISFNELKYFTAVTTLPKRMFYGCQISSIEFPKNLKHIKNRVFFKCQFDNKDFIFPDSVNSLEVSMFNYSNLRSITGNNIFYIYGNIASSLPNLEEVNLPNLREVKISEEFPQGLTMLINLPKLKIINFPQLTRINTIYYLFYNCSSLEEVICPKLQDLGIFIDINTKKINKLILGDKIDTAIVYCKQDNSIPLITNIKFRFDKDVKIKNSSVFYNNLTRYNNITGSLPIPIQDLSDIIFQGKVTGMNNILKNYSTVHISTETFKSQLVFDQNDPYINTNLGFSEIYIVKSESKKIEKFTLGNSSCLQKLFLQTDIKEIDDLAFKYCPYLQEVNLNTELEKIGSFAFALASKEYPAGAEYMPGDTQVKLLKTFNIPKNVHTIGDNPLFGQEELTKDAFTLDTKNKNFILENGILYNKDKSKIILATCDVQIDRIPDTVTEIGAGAFAFNKYTGELTIPSSVKKIGYLAFTYSKFQSIKFEDSINNIIFEKTGNNILYIFNTFQNVTLSNFYGMDNPSFYVEGRNASKQELNILKLNANIDQSNYIRVSLPNTLYSEDFDLVVPVGIKAYTYKKQGDTYVKSKTYEEGKVIPKGEAVTLEGEQGEYIFPIIKNQAVDKDKDNVLIGTNKDIEGNGNYYIFNNGSIELSGESNIIKENTVYIKKD